MLSWLRSAGLASASAFSLSLFFSLWIEARHFNIINHSPVLSWRFLFPFFLLALIVILFLWFLSSLLINRFTRQDLPATIKNNACSLLPFIFLSFAPLTLSHFITSHDLNKRFILYLFLVIGFFFWLQILFIKEGSGKLAIKERFIALFEHQSARKKSALLFLIAFITFSLGAFFLNYRGADFSGDEPHYLIIAHSLLIDHDFDLANNYEQRDYQQFLRSRVIIQPHTVPGAKPGSRLSFHSPGVSFLILPFYFFGRLLGRSALTLFPRLGICLWGALFCWQIFLLIKEKGWGERLALKLWAISAFISPIFFYSIHIYPEIIIACLSLIIFRWLTKFPELKSCLLALSGLLLSSFLWFHAIKYTFIIIPLFLLALIKILKTERKFKNSFIFLCSFFAGILSYFAFQKSLYGSFNPTSVSWQGAMGSQESLAFLKFIFLSIPFRFRWETLAGYFLDQRDGLLFYAPVYLLAFVGLLTMLRKRNKSAWQIILLTWPYFFFSAFLTQRTGYAPQARPLVASFWGFSLFLGYFFLTNSKRSLVFLARLTLIGSLIITILLVFYPLNLYQETTAGTTDRAGGLFLLLSNLHFSLPQILPSFLKIEESFWLPNYIWLGLLFIFLGLSQLKFDLRIRFNFQFKTLFVLVFLCLLLFWFVYYPRLVLDHPVKKRWPENQIITFYSLSRVAQIKTPGCFSLPQANRPYHFWFKTSTRLKDIQIGLFSPAGEISVDLLTFDYPIFKEKISNFKQSLNLPNPPFYRWGQNYLYWLTINVGPEEKGRLSERPFEFSFILK